MQRSVPFLAGFGLAAGLAAAGWLLRIAPERDDAARRLADAEETARRTAREAADARLWAESERQRAKELDERVREYERVLGGAAPGAPDPRTLRMDPPEQWDRERVRSEIDAMARAKDSERQPRYALILRALKAGGDAGAEIVLDLLRTSGDAAVVAVAASLADGLDEARAVPLLLARWKSETDMVARARILRSLANLPGDEAVGIFTAVWGDPRSDGNLRKFAIQGLALRGHPVAREAASMQSDGERHHAAQRKIAVEWLRVHAERGGWQDTSLVALFGKVLRSADGPEQRRLALLALEGFWSKDAIPDLEAFAADPGSPQEIAERARRIAQALRSGAPRPADAGQSAAPGDAGGH